MHKITWVIASLFLREDPDGEGGVSADSQDQAACLEGGGDVGRGGQRRGTVWAGFILSPCTQPGGRVLGQIHAPTSGETLP